MLPQQDNQTHLNNMLSQHVNRQNNNNMIISRTHRSRSSTPWHLSHCLFLMILMVRMMRHDSQDVVPWWLTFSPILISSIIILYIKICETLSILHYNRNDNNINNILSFRILCSLFDHIGYTITVIMTLLYLQTTIIPNVSTLCSPLLLTSIITLSYRIINLPPIDSRTIGRLFISSLVNCIVHTFIRIIQPILLLLKLDSYVDMSWNYVALPLWIMCVGGFIASIVLFYFAIFLHQHANVILRIHASRLMILCSIQLVAVSCCLFISSYW